MRRPRFRISTGWLCALGLLLPLAASALPSPFPPGLEKDVTDLVTGARLSNGCQLNGIRIESDFIDMRVECGAESGVLRLTSVEDSDADALRKTTSFVIHLQEPASPQVRGAATELAAHIATRDQGTILSKANVIRSQRSDQGAGAQARQLGLLDNLRRFFVWMGLLLSLFLLSIAAIRQLSQRMIWLSFLVLAFVGALLVRLKLGYWAPIHANSHGVAELRGLVASSTDWQGPVESDRYGVAYRQILRLLLLVVDDRAYAVFLFSIIASALGVIPLAVLGTRLSGSRFVGAVAALGLAFHPIHIALSGTESSFGLAGTLFLIGAACLCSLPTFTTDQDRARAWWAGALALSAACELSVITLALPVAALLIAVAVMGRQDRRLWQWPMIVLLASMALHFDVLWPVLRQARDLRGGEFGGTVRSSFSADRNALTNATLAASTLLPLAVVGFIALLVQRRRVGLTLAAASVLLLVVSVSVNGCRTDVIRYQPIAHLLLFVAAASALLWIPRRGVGLEAGGAVLLALALLVPTRTAFAELRKPLLDVSAYRVAEKAAAESPSELQVIVPPHRMSMRDVLSDFPDYVFMAAKRKVQVAEVGTEKEVPPGSACYVWVSQACFSFTDQEVANGTVDKAVRMGKAPLRKECEPLVERIDATKEPLVAAELPVPFREWEFLKVPAKPVVGMFPCMPGKPNPETAAVPAAKP